MMVSPVVAIRGFHHYDVGFEHMVIAQDVLHAVYLDERPQRAAAAVAVGGSLTSLRKFPA